MQISKSFLVVCAAAYCVALLPLRSADADTDAKLREALQKKLDELQTQPPAAAPKPVVAAPQPKKTPAPASAPVSVAAPVAPPPPAPEVSAPPPVDSESIEKAREALRQKMDELQTPPAVVAPTPPGGRPTPPAQWAPPPVAQPARPVTEPAPVPAPKPVPAPAVQATPAPVLTAPPPVDPEAIAKAREALRQKMAEMDAQSPPATAVPAQPAPAFQPVPAVVPPAPADPEAIAKAREAMEKKMKELIAQESAEPPAVPPTVPKPAKVKGAPAFPPLAGPPPAVSADKEQRLQELLRKYRADQITPEQYHEQRAKILAEP